MFDIVLLVFLALSAIFVLVLSGVLERPQEPTTQRRNIINEIIATERSYVAQLNQLCDYYLTPLRQSNILAPAEITAIFSNVEAIRMLNSDLLSSLESQVANNNNNNNNDSRMRKMDPHPVPMVGEIFAKRIQQLRLYVPFVNNYQKSQETLLKLREKNKEFARFLNQCIDKLQEKEGRYIDIESLLITPVQRLVRYRLLLEDLLKHSTPRSADYNALVKATHDINDIAMHVNEKRRDIENQLQVLKIHNELGIKEEVVPSRRLVREGACKIKNSNNSGSFTDCKLYLFTDILIAVYKKLLQRIVLIVTLEDCKVEDGLQQGFIIKLIKKATNNNKQDQQQQQLVELRCSTEEEHLAWINAIRETQEKGAALSARRRRMRLSATNTNTNTDSSVVVVVGPAAAAAADGTPRTPTPTTTTAAAAAAVSTATTWSSSSNRYTI